MLLSAASQQLGLQFWYNTPGIQVPQPCTNAISCIWRLFGRWGCSATCHMSRCPGSRSSWSLWWAIAVNIFFWEAQVTWTDLMNQATQRSEQKHRQPVKPELAAGTGGTPQRYCDWAASSACWNRALQQPTQVKIVRHGQPKLRTLREAQ